MGSYASTTDVGARVPYRAIGASTNPSSTVVSGWIDDAEAELDGVLGAQGLSTPLTGTGPVRIAKSWVSEYVAGLVMRAYATAGGDPNNEQGSTEIAQWRARMTEIARDASRFGSVLGQGSTAATLTSYPRLSGLPDSDFAPRFTTTEKF